MSLVNELEQLSPKQKPFGTILVCWFLYLKMKVFVYSKSSLVDTLSIFLGRGFKLEQDPTRWPSVRVLYPK